MSFQPASACVQSCSSAPFADPGDSAADEVYTETALHGLAVGSSGAAHGWYHRQPAQQLRVKYALLLSP